MGEFTALNAEQLIALERSVLAAAASGEQPTLMQLYRRASEHYLACGDIDQACFFATNAWVIALSIGDEAEHELHLFLAQHGRVPAA